MNAPLPRFNSPLRVALLGAGLALAGCTGIGVSTDQVARPDPVAGEHRIMAEQAAQAAAERAQRQSQQRLSRAAKLQMAPPQSTPWPVTGAPGPEIRYVLEPRDRENYAVIEENPLTRVAEAPVSTFSVDVDTASYANVRRFLNDGRLPPSDAVRVEELINYFDYGDPGPATRDTPFAVHTEVGPTPWNANTHLLRIAVKAWEPVDEPRPAANLVFLVDVSGSMHAPDKLPLLKRSLTLLTKQLSAEDKVSLVVYAGASGVVLAPTPGDQRVTIGEALDSLRAGGATNGASGIRLAYQLARQAFIPDGINRVLLATDGDVNVGTVDHEALMDLIERERRSGVALTTLGFGSGNYNDHLLEQLADRGNGNHAYIDTLMEARRVLVDQLGATLQTVARDVKVQIEFNPARVAEYRLIGYQNRLLAREDFNNDQVDAGEIGAGHSVTALYEITLSEARPGIDPLRYHTAHAKPSPHADTQQELAYLKLRYKPMDDANSVLVSEPIDTAAMAASLTDTSPAFRLAAAVAGFGELLRGGRYLNGARYTDFAELALNANHAAPGPLDTQRAGFVELVRLADALDAPAVAQQGR